MKELDQIKRKQFFEKVRDQSSISKQWMHSSHSYNCSHKSEENKFDFYKSKTRSDKAVIYLHGGAWTTLTLDVSSFLAEYFINLGFNFVPIGFNPATVAGMTNMLLEVQSAFKEILKIYPDQTEIYIMGHSAGAHLGILSYLYDFFPSDLQFSTEERNRIYGFILISGTYDLRMISQDASFSHLKMSSEEAWKLSPLRCVNEFKKYNSNLKIFMIVEDDPDFHFLKHNQELSDIIKTILKKENIIFFALKDVDHFDIVSRIGDVDYEVTMNLERFLSTV